MLGAGLACSGAVRPPRLKLTNCRGQLVQPCHLQLPAVPHYTDPPPAAAPTAGCVQAA